VSVLLQAHTHHIATKLKITPTQLNEKQLKGEKDRRMNEKFTHLSDKRQIIKKERKKGEINTIDWD